MTQNAPLPKLLTDPVLRAIREKAETLQFGKIVLTVQEGVVTYVDTECRVRIPK